MSLITYVIPTRNEEAGVEDLFDAIKNITFELNQIGHTLEVVIVDNYSSDFTVARISEISLKESIRVNLYRLNRNYGLQRSLLFGMSRATGDAVVTLQSDLQDPVSASIEMVQAWQSGARTVAGISHKRSEKKSTILSSGIFYYVINFLSDTIIIKWFQDFFLLDKSIYTDLARRINHYEFLRGRIVEEYGIDKKIYYERLARKKGVSNFNFASRYSIAMDGITRFGTKLIRRYVILGASVLGLAALGFFTNIIGLIITGERYLGNILAWAIIVFLGLILFASGIILEYLIRLLKLSSINSTEIYFEKLL
jgi:glycosyltransferase involved in cell wall biosynthesis